MQTCLCVCCDLCVSACVYMQGSAKHTALFLRGLFREELLHKKLLEGVIWIPMPEVRQSQAVVKALSFDHHYILSLNNVTHISPVDCKQHVFKMSLLKAFYHNQQSTHYLSISFSLKGLGFTITQGCGSPFITDYI